MIDKWPNLTRPYFHGHLVHAPWLTILNGKVKEIKNVSNEKTNFIPISFKLIHHEIKIFLIEFHAIVMLSYDLWLGFV